jgi:hypothetical protein
MALGALAEGRTALVSFRRLTIPDDVPAHLCSAIVQDARGFLWFGTQGGLVRYDGYEWRVFRVNPADPSTLAGNYVRALLPSRDGRLWALLGRTFRASDYVVRWGGEEFLIIIRFVDRAAAPELAEKLRAAIAAHPFPLPDGTTLRRTCSIGYATWRMQHLTWEQVLDRADAALYAAKRGGRDACVGAETLVA